MREGHLPGILFALLVVLPYLGAVVTALTPLVAGLIGRWRSEEEQVAPAAAVVAGLACAVEVAVAAVLLLTRPVGAEVHLGPLPLRASTPALRAICTSGVAALVGSLWAVARAGGRLRTSLAAGLMLWLGWAALAAAGAAFWSRRTAAPAAAGLALAAALLAAAMIRGTTAPAGRRRTAEAVGLVAVFALALLAVGAVVFASGP